MKTRTVTQQTDDYERVIALYEEAFPPEERFPVDELVAMSAKPEVKFEAYHDDGLFCGFTYNIETPSYLYVLFLAVVADKRSSGVGSRILEHLKVQYPDRTHVLEIEPLDPAADNYDQRVKRLAFYERNGFTRTGFDLLEDDMRYTVLAMGDFSLDTFKEQVDAVIQESFPVVLKPAQD